MKKILSQMRRTVQQYNMIQNSDKIAVAVSGGKDSMVLAKALCRLKEFYPQKFEVGAICIDIGFKGADFDTVVKFCETINITCHIEKTVIKQVVFDQMKEKSPCSLCSRMRRAALCDTAERLGYNKIALGHNRDDVIETLIMNLMMRGKIECFEPVTKYEDKRIDIIRPMIAISEGVISSCQRRNNIPVMDKICPVDGKTEREKIKALISGLSQENKNIKNSIYTAIEKLDSFISKEAKEVDNR